MCAVVLPLSLETVFQEPRTNWKPCFPPKPTKTNHKWKFRNCNNTSISYYVTKVQKAKLKLSQNIAVKVKRDTEQLHDLGFA